MINDLLKKIKEAIYGEEVRNSIHDAIEQCYKDATGHPESVAATVKEIGEVSANLSKETTDRKAEVSTERKRIDNLIATGTAQTQEIGKKIIQDSSISSSGIVLKGLTNNNYYYKLFEESGSIDSEFCTITNQQGKYTAKLLKPGLYYMNFKVHVEMSGGFSEEVIAPLKLFKSNTLDWSTFDVLDAETVEISKTENTSINKKIHFLFRVAEPSYIRIYIDIDTSHTKTITFRIDGCDIIALDWKGKQSADLSELHDLRIGADGVVHNTAGEAVRKQIGNLTEELTDVTDVIELKSINVFDVNNLIMGKIKNTWEGQTINDVSNLENGYYTDTIYNVKKGDVIRSSTNYIIASFYDKQGKYVTRYNFDTSKEYEIANDNICKMIIMCAENDAVYTTKLMVTINNDMPDNYVPYSGLSTQYNIPKKINEIDSELKKVIKTPFVILNFDAFTELDERYKIINEYGFKASAVASGDKNVNDTLQKKGWDIALYGYTGWPYDLKDIDVEADTDEAKKIWENYVNSTIDNAIKTGVYNPTAWNCRKNRFCENLGYALQKAGIKMARGDCWKDGKRIAGEYYTDTFSYCTLTYGLYPSTVNTCLSKIDYAVENNYGINIFTHKIYDTESDATANYGCTKQNLIDVLEKIKYYHDKGKLNVLTYREVYQLYFKNDSDNYDYNRLFKKIINDKQNNTNNSLMIQEGNIVDVVTIENMSSGYIDKAGQLCSNNSAKTTDFIDISDYIIYLTANKQYETKLCGIYDINKNFIAILDDMLIEQTSKSDLCTVENLKIDFKAIQNIYPTAYYYRICTYIPSKGFKLSYKQKISVLDYIKTEKNEVTKFNILYGKKYVSCGDSYTEGDFSGYTDENGLSGKNSPVIYDTNRKMYKTYPWWIAERNNMTLINEAKCGTTITNAFNGERNPFSVSRYLAIPTDADYVTLMFGLNEIGLTDEQIGSKTDTDNTTLWGAYNIVFKHFLTNMPLAKIGVIIADAWMNEKYANAVKGICKNWGIPVLDLKFDTSITAGISGRTGMNSDAISLRDKVFALSNNHPSVEAHKYRSTIIEHWLRSL